MKKRTLISIVITIVCIALTNKFWFCIKPLQISFKAEGSGDTKFELFLNKEDNNDFKKVKYGVIEANLDENNSVELFINRVHKAKRVKITVSAVSTPHPQLKNIILSEFELRYGKYKLDDLKAFSVEGAKLKIDGDRLIIYPESETVSLIYNKPVDLKSSTKFDIKVLIVITVLSFLLSYKLTSYLADFKTLNNASRMDIVFLFIFFILLFIPMSHIDTQSETSEKENRTLAKYEPFIKDKMINFDYGNDFEKWFNDRFAGRSSTIKIFGSVKYKLNSNYNDKFMLKGKDDWLFLSLNNSEKNYLNLDKFSKEDLQKAVDYLVSIDKYCKKHNKKFILVICPDKNKIYGEYYPDLYLKNISDTKSRANQLIAELKKNNVDVLYLYEVMQNNKNNKYNSLLYYKNDTHWNHYGAYLGYIELLKKIGIKPVSVTFNEKEIHENGDLNRRYSFVKKEKEEYLYPKIQKPTAQCTKKSNPKHDLTSGHEDVICKADNKNPKVVFYRDSFTGALLPYLQESFKTSKYYWTNQVRKSEIEDSDIVVIERVERLITVFANMKPIKE